MSKRHARDVLALVALAAVAAVIVLHGASAEHGAMHLAADTSTVSASLSDDDDGRPMFDLPAMPPGASASRCIELTYSGAGRGAAVSMKAAVTGGKIADQLGLRIEHGTGGGFDSCRGFKGTQVFDGTVGDARRLDLEPAWSPGSASEHATFRLTVTAPGDLDATSVAGASFTWAVADPSNPAPAAQPADMPAATPPTAADTPATSPKNQAGAPRDAKHAHRGATTAPAHPGRPSPAPRHQAPTSGAPAARAHPATQPAPPAHHDTGLAGAVKRQLKRVLEGARTVAVQGGKRAAIPGALIALLGSFLLIQHLLDRRDPKLALAPVQRDAD